MLYSISSAEYPIQYSSCGMLVSKDQFLHMNRLIDTYVLILVVKGTLYITMDNIEYTVGPGQFVVLFPYLRHVGTRPSEGPLRYYWMHFSLADPEAQTCDVAESAEVGPILQAMPQATDPSADASDTHYIIPATGELYDNKRPSIMFQSLLDMVRRDHYEITQRTRYLASYLLLEVLHDAAQRRDAESSGLSDATFLVLDYIRTHYAEPITTQAIADAFDYHPVYLERLFKRELGSTITQSINKTRIEASQNLLVSTGLPIDSIATSCGFSDAKYYMRVFRRYTNMTPSQYRRSLFRKNENTR